LEEIIEWWMLKRRGMSSVYVEHLWKWNDVFQLLFFIVGAGLR